MANQVKRYYKLGQVLQIREIVINWDIKYTSLRFFSIHERYVKFGFLNTLGCTSKFFRIHERV